MHTECLRIADQLRRAFTGDPWHGDPLQTLLAGVTPTEAVARPLGSAHNIHELVLHIDIYVRIALEATTAGTPMPKLYRTGSDWQAVTEPDSASWNSATENLFRNADQLAQAVSVFRDTRLHDTVPGREYDFYYLFHGIVQHTLYHGGQIALLKSAGKVSRDAEKRI